MTINEIMDTSAMNDPFSFLTIDGTGKPVAPSTQVAEFFEKKHFHVLRDIEGIIEAVSPKFAEENYYKTSYMDDRGRLQPMYEMTKNGFTMLAMGYTGPKAMQFKEAYINAFDKMAEQLGKKNEGYLYRVECVTEATVKKEMAKTRKELIKLVQDQVKRLR